MPVPGPHTCLLWLVRRCCASSIYDLGNYPRVRTRTYARMNAHTHKTVSCVRTHVIHTHTHTHSLKANSSETREDRPLCVRVTEWITRRAKTLASCLTQQRPDGFQMDFAESCAKKKKKQWVNIGVMANRWRKNNSQAIWGENVRLGHFAPQSCHPAITSLEPSQPAPFTAPDSTTAQKYLSIPEPIICELRNRIFPDSETRSTEGGKKKTEKKKKGNSN